MLRRSLAAAAAVLIAAPAHAQRFDFEGADSPVGTTTPFSLTRSGLTATFDAHPNEFAVVGPVDFANLTGNALADNDAQLNTLEILFDQLLPSVSLLFALDDPTNTAILTMNVFDGANLVGQVFSSGAIPPGPLGLPEGVLSFSGGPFNRLVLFSDLAPGFAIDDVQAGPAAVVPEPATVGLLATGLLAVGGAAARRRRAG
jgi:hypothetical protein